MVIDRVPRACYGCEPDSPVPGHVENRESRPFCETCQRFCGNQYEDCRRSRHVLVLKYEVTWVPCQTCQGGRIRFWDDIQGFCPGSNGRFHNQ